MTDAVDAGREITLGPRRQLTLPKDICLQLGLKIGDTVSVTVDGDRLIARPVRNAALDAIHEIRRLLKESEIAESDLQEAGRQVRRRLNPTHG